MEPIDKRHHGTIISRLKVMSELDIAEKRVPQDGRFKLRLTQRTIDFRVSILPTVHGEDCVIRILDKESMSKDFKNLKLDILGFDDDTMRKLRKFIREPYGMVLVTGPTGSGKTTTLYACLSEIQSSEDKIITIEDPVEYQLRGITQIPINEKKGLTFARGLRSILRHDPDKVMVGEIRDEDTAQIAIQSALTGHLVFTTVHANNVVDVLGRFLNMKVDLYNFVSALNCVLAQRLVRKICQHCKQPMQASRQLLDDSGLDSAMYSDCTFYEGTGCIECNGTGFLGRLAVSELLDLSDHIRELILDRRPASEIKRAAEEGMTFCANLRGGFSGSATLREINKSPSGDRADRIRSAWKTGAAAAHVLDGWAIGALCRRALTARDMAAQLAPGPLPRDSFHAALSEARARSRGLHGVVGGMVQGEGIREASLSCPTLLRVSSGDHRLPSKAEHRTRARWNCADSFPARDELASRRRVEPRRSRKGPGAASGLRGRAAPRAVEDSFAGTNVASPHHQPSWRCWRPWKYQPRGFSAIVQVGPRAQRSRAAASPRCTALAFRVGCPRAARRSVS